MCQLSRWSRLTDAPIIRLLLYVSTFLPSGALRFQEHKFTLELRYDELGAPSDSFFTTRYDKLGAPCDSFFYYTVRRFGSQIKFKTLGTTNLESEGAPMTTIWEDKRRQMILNVTLFSLNGTTNSESEGAPLTTI